ncbi:proton-coupled folate transporter-like [Ornithodoros turicata]|uniref:proton-coupled folate transporter-like n=1 Tax=Ornithodoros turicata TaxID=34597 RepID=UPI003138D38D
MGLPITVEPILFLFFVCLNLEISALQDLISTKLCFEILNTSNISLCHSAPDQVLSEIKSSASVWLMYYNGTLCLLCLICGFWVGSWNDRFGRKRPMLLPPVAAIFSTINFILVSHFLESHVGFVLISSVIIGISTGTLGIFSSCFGYIADVTGLASRSRRIAILEAMVFTGGACGMYIAGVMLKKTSYEAVFGLELGLHVLTVFYILLFVTDRNRADLALPDNEPRSVFSLSHVADMVKTVFQSRENGHRTHVILLFASTFVMYFGLSAQIYLTYTYLTDEPLRWNASQYSFLHGVTIAVEGSALLVLLPLAFRFLGISDAFAGLLGAASRCAGLLWLGLSTTTVMAFCSPMFFTFSEFGVPATRAILSKIVGTDEKGKAFAAMGSLQSVAMIAGAAAFNGLYPVTSKFFKGFGFELAGALQLMPVAVFIYLCIKLRYMAPSPYAAIGSGGGTDRALQAV